MFRTILIANRGEIACRIIRTARRMGIRSVAVFSEADAKAQHVALADAALPIGPARAADSYLRIDRILDAARASGAEAIHPGYGFLSENAGFAEACAEAGIVFIGPPPAAIRAMGSKAESKRLMERGRRPPRPRLSRRGPGRGACSPTQAARIGFPVLIKASAGGGGKGMRPVLRAEDFAAQLAGARREAKAAFGDDRVLLERYLQKPRHVEVQVFADTQGNTLHLHTRDCSVQRRHQKVLEEAPAPDLPPALARPAARGRRRRRARRRLCRRRHGGVHRRGRRRLLHGDEHPPAGRASGDGDGHRPRPGRMAVAHRRRRAPAADARPRRRMATASRSGSMPRTRRRISAPPPVRCAASHLPEPAPDLRIESGVREGDAITPFYDPMIAKLVAWGPDRPRGAGAARRGARRMPDRRHHQQPRLPAAAGRASGDAGGAARHRLRRPLRRRPAAAGAPRARIWRWPPRRWRCCCPPPARAADPWERYDGWRLQGGGSQLVLLADGDAVHRLRLLHAGAGWRVELDGADAVLAGRRLDGALQVTLDGAIHRIPVLRDGDAIQVALPEGDWILRLRDPYIPAEGEAVGQGRLAAPIPGRVVQVLVKEGESVSRGQVLAVLEAMKTELRITAPADGVVAHIGCAAGDSVEEGTEIVTLVAPD